MDKPLILSTTDRDMDVRELNMGTLFIRVLVGFKVIRDDIHYFIFINSNKTIMPGDGMDSVLPPVKNDRMVKE